MASEEFSYANVRMEAYEGATTSYRMEQKGLLSGDQDLLAGRELRFLWSRSHHAIRNNGWAASAKQRYMENLSSICVKWKDDKGKINKKMQALWEEFVKSPNLDGYGTLGNTQLVWSGALFESGEALTRMLIKKRDKFTIPLILQTIESEYLDPTFNNGDPLVTRNGITFKDSKPEIYHFFKNISSMFMTTTLERIQVPASEVIHIFERGRPGQWRGIPKLAPILLPLYELDDLTDATVAKQKAAQAISWIIRNTNPSSATSVGMGINVDDERDIDQSTGKRRVIMQASAGGVQYLNKGEDIAFYQGTDIGANLPELIKSELHKIAQASGISYEDLSGDLTGLSFSALQAVALEMKTRAEFIYKYYIINLGLQPLCDRFQELAVIYVNKNLGNLVPVYQYPRKYGVNDLKDAQADILELDGNIGLLQAKLSERDISFEELMDDLDRRIEVSEKVAKINANVKPVINNNQSNNTKANTNSR